jgi:AcrR family transcriptional regulator
MSVDRTRKDEILDTAARLFASSGMRTSLKQIADACGILPGSLYHHFESKDAIVVALIERYRTALDEVAEQALAQHEAPDAPPVPDQLLALSTAIATGAARHRAAMLQGFYDPHSGASAELVRVAQRSPLAVETAMLELLRAGRTTGYIRAGIDLPTLAERLCQTMLYLGIAVQPDVRGADRLPELRCRIMLEGVAVDAPTDAALDRSKAFAAAQEVVSTWDKAELEEDERFVQLRTAARREFGRKGFEATTVRDIAAAAGMSTGSVYRLVGSKDELLTSIMGSFPARVQAGWRRVLATEATAVEKLDALMWIDVNVVDHFSDEYNIQLSWLRESPPSTSDVGQNFVTLMRDLKALLAEGKRAGELAVPGPSADMRAWALFDPMWMHEGIVRRVGAADALKLGRDSVVRGAAQRP